MKFGQVTFYFINYGSILQAYALQQIFIREGHECEIVRHSFSSKEDQIYRMLRRICFYGLFSSVSHYRKVLREHSAIRAHSQEGVSRRQNVLNEFASANIAQSPICYKSANYRDSRNAYDAFVCGSDQIWNPQFTVYSDFYWLGFLDKTVPHFAYSPSMGSYSLTKKHKLMVKKYLSSYAMVSVREAAGKGVFESILPETNVEVALDPTLLFDSASWLDKIKDKNAKEKDPYVFAYTVYGNEEQRDYASAVAKNPGCKLLVYPELRGGNFWDTGDWGDVRAFDDDPFDFLARIRDAKAIVTDSFHCSVFSLLFGKDLRVMPADGIVSSQTDRLTNLLHMCGAENCFVQSYQDFDIRSYGNVDDVLAPVRNQSLAYLRKAIDLCSKDVNNA